MLKNNDCRFSNWLSVKVSKPVVWSSVPPVAFWYAWNASVAIISSVVPVSTIPAEPDSNVVPPLPYVRSWLIPQYWLAGDVVVIGVKSISPVYLELSTPPNVSSPFTAPSLDVGSYEMPIESWGILPSAKRLSVTVGTGCWVESVPSVRSTGPIPRMPSTSLKPWAVDATPIDWFVITRSGARVTVSVTTGNRRSQGCD